MSKKYVFITGANTGIGLETIKALLQSSQAYHIFLGSRSVDKGNAAKAELEKGLGGSASVIEVVQIDIASDESINAAYEHVKNGPGYLDILVNNAGKLGPAVCNPPRWLYRSQFQGTRPTAGG